MRPGFARGFVLLRQSAEFLYRATDYWYPEYGRGLVCNDNKVVVTWPIDFVPEIAPKDDSGQLLREADRFE